MPHCRGMQIKGKETTKQQTQNKINEMLAAVNKNDKFTDGEYNILRVVVAFPLAVDFNSQSYKVSSKALTALARIPFSPKIAGKLNVIVVWYRGTDGANSNKRTRSTTALLSAVSAVASEQLSLLFPLTYANLEKGEGVQKRERSGTAPLLQR